MDKERLIALGLSNEQADRVLKAHNDTISNNFVPLHRFNDINTQLKTANDTIATRDKQIADLGENTESMEQLEAQVQTLTKQNAEQAAQYQKDLQAERKRSAVINNIADSVHNANLVLSLLDLEAIEVNDNGEIVKGLKEQIDAQVKENPFLFKEGAEAAAPNTVTPRGATPKTPKQKQTATPDASEVFAKQLAAKQATASSAAHAHYFGNSNNDE